MRNVVSLWLAVLGCWVIGVATSNLYVEYPASRLFGLLLAANVLAMTIALAALIVCGKKKW